MAIRCGLPSALFCVIVGKNRFIGDERETAIQEGIPELGGTVFNHMTSRLRLAGLKVTRFQAGKGKHFRWVLELAEVLELREDDGG